MSPNFLSRVERDIELARLGDTAIELDRYRPETLGAPMPLIIWAHGGGWSGGDKANYVALPLSGRG